MDPHHVLEQLPKLMRPRLRRMAQDDPDPLLREMASGLLDGSIASPAQAMRFGPYAEALRGRTEAFGEWYAGLDDEEQRLLRDIGRHHLRDEIERLDAE